MCIKNTVRVWSVAEESIIAEARVDRSAERDSLGYQFVRLPAPMVLKADTAYRIVSREFQGGDPWGDRGR